MLRWLIFITVYLLIDIYVFQVFKTISKNKILYSLYWIISALVFANFLYQLSISFDRSIGLTPKTNQAIGLFLTLFVPKIVILLFVFGEDIFRTPQALYRLFTEGRSVENNYFPSRRKFISQIALIAAAIPFSSLLYGMYKGKYNYKVLKYVLEYDDLPTAFDGYQITQISDIHSGSLDNAKKIEYGVDLINQQESDIILFTGDLVNNRADEMDQWIDTFKKLKAKDGKFSVLGNHDYGDYIDWKSNDAKVQNMKKLENVHQQLGFDLLLNDNRTLEKNGEKIALIGVENWGAGGFKKAGDLQQATAGIKSEDFKILMSHDPSHWEQQVKNNDVHYHLTLSGHTHGMQFGIEIPGWIKWSPVKWRYKYWAGIYEEAGRYINVNRGFGFLAYPGRVGIWPEITVITLKKRITPIVT
ncbi:MAG: metallophosphoesterase [Flavobacteriaceae bacterium]|nr:metallophosphoesterase [Flavobacteriaceae bacterium]